MRRQLGVLARVKRIEQRPQRLVAFRLRQLARLRARALLIPARNPVAEVILVAHLAPARRTNILTDGFFFFRQFQHRRMPVHIGQIRAANQTRSARAPKLKITVHAHTRETPEGKRSHRYWQLVARRQRRVAGIAARESG